MEYQEFCLANDDEISLVMPSWYDDEDDFFEIRLNLSDEVVGNITLRKYVDKVVGNVEYFIEEEYRNKGYAKRSLKLLAENVYKIKPIDLRIVILPNNKASIKVAKSSGAVLIKKVKIPENYAFSEDGKYKYANWYVIKNRKDKKGKIK